MRSNVLDLAVGIVIGSAFGKIVSSLVSDVIMPPIGLLIGGVNFTEIKLTLKGTVTDVTGKIVTQPVTLNIGNFFQVLIDFIIIAFAIFLVVKAVNKFQKRKDDVQAVPPAPSKEETLLCEIRDILKSK
jgi:large conductance mechanosensitive channel